MRPPRNLCYLWKNQQGNGLRQERWHHFTKAEEDRLHARGYRIVRDARGLALRIEEIDRYPVTAYEGFRRRGLIDPFCKEAIDEYVTARHAFVRTLDAKGNSVYHLKDGWYGVSDGWHVELYKAFADVVPRARRVLVDEALVTLAYSKADLNRMATLYLDAIRQMDEWWGVARSLAAERCKAQRERELSDAQHNA